MANSDDRIIALIDMDCFFCQVEVKANPSLKMDKPMAVVQYNSFVPGTIIAVNYAAREFGLTKRIKPWEAKEKCPHIQLVTVPPLNDKPDTERYRIAGKEVMDVLKKYCNKIERASIDEAYLDLTDIVDKKLEEISSHESSSPSTLQHMSSQLTNTFVVGYCDESNDEEKRREGIVRWIDEAFDDLGELQARKLAIAGTIVEELRNHAFLETQYRCSAGISYNKILAKLACGLHKPNKQTILPSAGVPGLFATLPVNKIRNLGGKLGNTLKESMGCSVMADVARLSLQQLRKQFDEKTGTWLYNIARGIDNEPVITRLARKSIATSKYFPEKKAITDLNDVKQWIHDLSIDMLERLHDDLHENERRATSLTVTYWYYPPADVVDRKPDEKSRTCCLPAYKTERIASICLDVFMKGPRRPLSLIGMSASKFVSAKPNGGIMNFFKVQSSKSRDDENKILIQEKPEDSQDVEIDLVDNLNRKMKNSVCNKNMIVNDNEKLDTNCDGNSEDLTDSKKLIEPFNGESLKNSFFMNFLKNSNSTSLPSTSRVQQQQQQPINTNNHESTLRENDSPDIFDDLESPTNSTNYNEDNKHEETENSVSSKSPLVQLQEIFPDLNDIDPSVVQLLPIELQRAANIYLKSKKSISPTVTSVSNTKNATINVTSTKTKAGKSMKKTNILDNFLVKNSSNSTSDLLMKRCPECDQMIRVEKFLEHTDFHVAKNLQRTINLSTNTEERNDTRTDTTSNTKRKINVEQTKSNKKLRVGNFSR